MSCPGENTILAFARGDLTAATTRTVELHIDHCAACAELVADAARLRSGSDEHADRPNAGSEPSTDPGMLATNVLTRGRIGTSPRHLEELRPGRCFGRYRIVDRLGAGGMGIVYRAHDPELDRAVALKLLRNAGGTDGSGGHARLLREAQLTAQLTHPNVVSVFEVGIEQGHVYLAMELVEGLDLRQWLEKPRPLPSVLDVFRQAARGLAAAHRAGVIHRDFKPDNVLVGDRSESGAGVGRVRVMDFGLARLRGSADLETEGVEAAISSSGSSMSAPLTATGTVMGTPAYMAPEQHIGHGIDERCDQYAFFVALYEALYGSRPFVGGNVAELAMHKQTGLTKISPRGTVRVPRWLRAALRRGLAPDPALRHASMEAVVDVLEQGPRRAARWVGAGAITVLGSGVAGLAWGGTTNPGPSCSGFRDTVEAMWGTTQRDAVEAALLATGLPYAEQTWARVESRLAAYASTWGDARVEACEAARGRETDAVAIAQRACLERRRAEMAALVRVLSEADEAVTAEAVRAVTELPAVSECASVTSFTTANGASQTLPDVQPLEDRLLDAAALGRAGRYTDAIGVAREVETRARALEHGSLLERSLVSVGEHSIRTGAFDDAEAALTEAYFGARERGDAPLAAQAASSMAASLGGHRQRTDEARKWLRHAEAELARYEAPVRAKALLLKVRAGVHLRAGEYEAALQENRAALELLRTELPDDHLLFSSYLNNLGNAYFLLGRYEEAIEHHLRALDLREQSLGHSHPYVGDSHGNLGAASYNLGRYEDSIVHHRKALAIASAALGPRSHDAAIGHNNLAGALHALGRHEEAIEQYRAALEAWTEIFGEHDPHVALAANNLGNVYQSQGRCTEGLQHYGRALDIRLRAHGQEHPDFAATLNNEAICLKAVGRLDEARTKFELALEIQERTLGPTHPDLGHALDNLAVLLREQERFDAAIAHHRRALHVRRSALGDRHVDVGESQYGLGRALLESGDAQAAVRELEQGVSVLESTGPPGTVAAARFALARALWASGERSERARSLAREALEAYRASDRTEQVDEVARWLRSPR